MFDVVILKEGVSLPQTGTYYIIAKDGVFLKKDTGIIDCIVKVDHLSFLQELKATVSLKISKIPANLMAQVILFFRRIYHLYGTEAVVLLHYSQDTHDFLLHCPGQLVNGVEVTYDSHERFPGYQFIGTIHSHNRMGAFHSPADRENEKDMDGLHITVGRVNEPYFDISCTIAVNNNRFLTEPEEVIDGVVKVDWEPQEFSDYKTSATSCFEESVNYLASMGAKTFGVILPEFTHMFPETTRQFYDLLLPEGYEYGNVEIPVGWIEKVVCKKFLNSSEYQSTGLKTLGEYK